MRVDLNADLGESFGVYALGQDDALLPLVSSANIACGFHAGDPSVMARTVRLAAEHGVGIGAHVGLPDLTGFGRREMALSAQEVYDLAAYQIGALAAFARREEQPLQHVKPHGALYHMAERDAEISQAIAQAVCDFDAGMVLMGQAGGRLIQAGRNAGLRVAGEIFADRAYQPDGTLTPRGKPGALLHDPAEAAPLMARAVREGILTAVDGSEFSVQADTICLHGDSPNAVAFARALREMLTVQDIEIKRLGEP